MSGKNSEQTNLYCQLFSPCLLVSDKCTVFRLCASALCTGTRRRARRKRERPVRPVSAEEITLRGAFSAAPHRRTREIALRSHIRTRKAHWQGNFAVLFRLVLQRDGLRLCGGASPARTPGWSADAERPTHSLRCAGLVVPAGAVRRRAGTRQLSAWRHEAAAVELLRHVRMRTRSR